MQRAGVGNLAQVVPGKPSKDNRDSDNSHNHTEALVELIELFLCTHLTYLPSGASYKI